MMTRDVRMVTDVKIRLEELVKKFQLINGHILNIYETN
jgi:hypothetical protein